MRVTKAFLAILAKDPVKTLNEMSTDDIATLLQKASYAYYNGDKPILSDDVFDMIREYMENRDPEHPILKSIGAVVTDDDLRKAKLPFVLASLDKIKTDEKELQKWSTKHPGACVVSDKLDGVSGLLYVQPDGIINLYTRGDGKVGQDVSHLLSFIRHIPPKAKLEAGLAVRGELIISKEDFATVAHKGANARNMVSGLVNAKIPDLALARLTQFVAYEMVALPESYGSLPLPSIAFEELKRMGFKTAFHTTLENGVSIPALSKILVDRRSKSSFEVDGVVVRHDRVYKRQSTNPTYAFAFKSIHTLDTVEVVVSHVEWNVSKDGFMKPVVVFPGARLSGVVIQRATGFNAKFIVDNKIGPGSRIMIFRSGDVIPYISKVLSPSASGEPHMPEVSYEWNKSGVDIIIASKTENDDVTFKNLEYFFKKIEVKGLAAGTLRKLFDNGMRTVISIATATRDDFLRVPGIKDKTADKLVHAINEKMSVLTCLQIMEASNAFGRGLGQKKLELVVQHIPAIVSTERFVPSVKHLVEIKGIEKTTAEQFISTLPTFWKFVDDNGLESACRSREASHAKESESSFSHTPTMPHPLYGAKVVFTGFRDKQLEDFVKSKGGEITGSVSKNTTILVTKEADSTSSKAVKAREIGVSVLSVNEFKDQFVESQGAPTKDPSPQRTSSPHAVPNIQKKTVVFNSQTLLPQAELFIQTVRAANIPEREKTRAYDMVSKLSRQLVNEHDNPDMVTDYIFEEALLERCDQEKVLVGSDALEEVIATFQLVLIDKAKTEKSPIVRKEEKRQIPKESTKECPEGKVLNPKTGRCVKKLSTSKETPKECPEGKVLNPKTGRCVKKLPSKQ